MNPETPLPSRPMPLNPQIAVRRVPPMAGNPVRVPIRLRNIGSGHPNVCMAIPAVVSLMPHPTWMLMWRRWHNLVANWRGGDANVNLCPRSRSNRKHRCKGGSKQLLSHEVTPPRGGCPDLLRLRRGNTTRSCGGKRQMRKFIGNLQLSYVVNKGDKTDARILARS